MKDYLLINEDGKNLLKNKDVYEKAKGSIFEDSFKETINTKYNEDITSHLINDDLLTFETYISTNFKEDIGKVLSNIDDIVKSIDNNIKSILDVDVEILSITKSFRTNYRFNYKHLELIANDKSYNIREEYLKLVMANSLKSISIPEKVKKAINLSYDKDVLTLSLIIIKDNISFFESIENVKMIHDVFEKIKEYSDICFKGKFVLEDNYSVSLNMAGNNIYRAFLECVDSNIDLTSLYKNIFTPAISSFFVNKDKNGLIDFLKKFKKYQSTLSDRKQYEIVDYWNKKLKQDIADYSAKKHLTVGVEKGKIVFMKRLKYDFKDITNYDFELIYPDKKNKEEKESFIVNIALSRLAFVGSDKFKGNFLKEDFKNSLEVLNDSLTLEFKVGYTLDEIKKTNARSICDLFENIYYKAGIIK